MFFYRFWSHFTHNIYQCSLPKTKSGDLLFDDGYYYLALGDDISRPEQWHTDISLHPSQRISSFLHDTTLSLVHRMVNERFSSYNKVLPLFVGSDITILLKHKLSPTKNPGTKNQEPGTKQQILLLFPSIISIQQYLNDHNDQEQSLILSGSSTLVQKAKGFRALSNGKETSLLATHSQIFQNRNNLTQIKVMDEHSPYYHTFQEPRYTIPLVIEKMRSIYQIV